MTREITFYVGWGDFTKPVGNVVFLGATSIDIQIESSGNNDIDYKNARVELDKIMCRGGHFDYYVNYWSWHEHENTPD